MSKRLSRRRFLKSSAAVLALAALPTRLYSFAVMRRAPIRLGIIGVANRGGDNLRELSGLAGVEIAALADVDERYLERAKKAHAGAKTFVDYREMIDAKGLDAVVVSTPDHHHAPATLRALGAGLDVYCEKPLSHTVAEARAMAELAKKNERVTQMGTQIHAGENYRRVVEHIEGGVIGSVGEVYVFCNGKSWSGGDRPREPMSPPKGFHWNLWLGPAPDRPYHSAYHPANWRRFWDFGGGTLADMGCHYADLAFWALKLKHPIKVGAEGPAPHQETTPADFIMHLDFPARDGLAACRLDWHDGGAKPPILKSLGLEAWSNGVLFVGEKGYLIADYDRLVLGPEAKAKEFKRPKATIPPSVGHHREWIDAIVSRGKTTCSFDYSSALSEAILLGNVAFRAKAPFGWNGAKLEADLPAAQALIAKSYRDGWKI